MRRLRESPDLLAAVFISGCVIDIGSNFADLIADYGEWNWWPAHLIIFIPFFMTIILWVFNPKNWE